MYVGTNGVLIEWLTEAGQLEADGVSRRSWVDVVCRVHRSVELLLFGRPNDFP